MYTNKNVRGRSYVLYFLSLFISLVTLFGSTYLISKTPDNFLYIFLFCACVSVFLFTLSAIIVNSIFKKHRVDSLKQDELYSTMFVKIRDLQEPAFICDASGKILWSNPFMQEASGQKSLVIGASYSNYFSGDLIESSELADVVIDGNNYKIERSSFEPDGKKYYLFVFRNITKECALEKTLKDTDKLVAYIVVDNLEELLQFEQEAYRDASVKIGEIIRTWANSNNGILIEYERDKYIFIFDAQYLKEFEEELLDKDELEEGETDDAGFNVLKRVRKICIGVAHIPVTLSIGIAQIEGTIAEKQKASHACFEMALQRGGDQAVVKTPIETRYYGAKNVATQRRTRVRARVMAHELIKNIKLASNVIIMGHKYPDYDAIGAAVGVAKICKYCGVKYNIVTNLNDINLKKTMKYLDNEEWNGVFIDGPQALDLVNITDTLVVLVDVNNIKMVEAPDILKSVDSNYIIIDHHRKADEFDKEPIFAYIETSASSASELVTEMIEQVVPLGTLEPDDAKLLFAGISLDTKQFAKNTGTKTYGAAMYLRDLGADFDNIADLFKSSLEDYKQEARFGEFIEIYNDNMAIVAKTTPSTMADKILAARVADNLLKINGIEASFVLVNIDDIVHVSARSGGNVNVHLILEEMGGGGHFNVAGGQFSKEDMDSVVTRLKTAIDNHTKREEIK